MYPLFRPCFPGRATSAGKHPRQISAASLLVLPIFLGGCADRPLPTQRAEHPAASASVAPATLRTSKGDLITGDAGVFAEALKEMGSDGEVLIWIKESGTPRPAAEFLLDLPSSGKEIIALPTEHPGAQRRRSIGPASVRGASIEAVVRALGQAGATPSRRAEVLPVLAVRLPEDKRLGALQALLRHPNVDYVSVVRARPVQLQAGPVGSNGMDTKHTVHRIPQVWDLTRGNGAKVGILDSGFARSSATGGFHNDGLFFSSHGILPLGFVDDGCDPTPARSGGCTPLDDQWLPDGRMAHGTQMAGLVGENDNDIGYVGIAPFATTYSMKIAWNTEVHGHCGFWPGNDDYYCIEDDDFIYAVDYASSRRLHVLSMSFTGGFSSDIYRALATARNSYGVFLVASTGNDKDGPAHEPASWDVVMGVAAVDAWGTNLYNTSARDVSGYGGGGTTRATCYRSSYCDAGSPGQVGGTGGTSAATAIVAGIVGLIRAQHPYESVSQVWNRLVRTAEGGNRVVNAYAAITYTPPLSASIWGPGYVDASTMQTWTASAANGTGPYSYTWYRDGYYVGTGDTYTDDTGGWDFELRVDVTDSAGGSTSAWQWVTVNQCASDGREICPVQAY
jgi:hypothetical protein